MTEEKRYTAEELESMARVIFREAGASEPLGKALFQAAETEAKVMGLVSAVKALLNPDQEPLRRVFLEQDVRIALSMFRVLEETKS